MGDKGDATRLCRNSDTGNAALRPKQMLPLLRRLPQEFRRPVPWGGYSFHTRKDGDIMKIIINENERGFLFKNGKYLRTLEPGKHVLLGRGYNVERMPVDTYPLCVVNCGLDTLLADPVLAK